MSRRIGALAAVLCAIGCGDPEATQLFTAAQATDVARAFQTALAAGDADALAKLCKAPFRYQGRTWDTTAEVAANWRKEIARARNGAGAFGSYEAFSRYDLKEGRWPRREAVDASEREKRIEALGLAPHGWLVRVYEGPNPGYRLTLNAEGATALLAQAFDR